MAETPREPDRFDKQAEELARKWVTAPLTKHAAQAFASALRAAESSALERAAQIADESREDGRCIAFAIRALIPPVAAPAAEPMDGAAEDAGPWGAGRGTFVGPAAPVADYDPIAAPIPEGDMNGPHGPAPAAETGEAPTLDADADLDAAVRRVYAHYGTDMKRFLADVRARAAPPEREGT